jgi:hypothetical protein
MRLPLCGHPGCGGCGRISDHPEVIARRSESGSRVRLARQDSRADSSLASVLFDHDSRVCARAVRRPSKCLRLIAFGPVQEFDLSHISSPPPRRLRLARRLVGRRSQPAVSLQLLCPCRCEQNLSPTTTQLMNSFSHTSDSHTGCSLCSHLG